MSRRDFDFDPTVFPRVKALYDDNRSSDEQQVSDVRGAYFLGIDFLVVAMRFAFPKFKRVRGCVVLDRENNSRDAVATWAKKPKTPRYQVESMLNHTHLDTNVENPADPLIDSAFEDDRDFEDAWKWIGKRLKASWEWSLRDQYPGEEFVVYYIEEEKILGAYSADKTLLVED